MPVFLAHTGTSVLVFVILVYILIIVICIAVISVYGIVVGIVICVFIIGILLYGIMRVSTAIFGIGLAVGAGCCRIRLVVRFLGFCEIGLVCTLVSRLRILVIV